MAKKKKTNQNKKKSNAFFWGVFGLFFVLSILLIGILKKEQLSFYYAMYFAKREHKTLTNTEFETKRINKIIEKYAGKTFGLDISHYQNREDIFWDSLTIAHGSISLDFIVLRATMGNFSKDKHFKYYWKKSKEAGLIRGAYHFYRPDEDPELQARLFLSTVRLEKGDLLPVLDIEKLPRQKSKAQYLKDIQTWLNIVEEHYGQKPIIYTYYHFYKDYLRGQFEDYPLWLANYNDVITPSPDDEWQIWQFTEKGISDGVNTKIDLNVFNGSKWEMSKLLID